MSISPALEILRGGLFLASGVSRDPVRIADIRPIAKAKPVHLPGEFSGVLMFQAQCGILLPAQRGLRDLRAQATRIGSYVTS
ncbi:MAG TPA: hypothetical protein DCX29_00320, partial [Hyphomonas sp.]|nr:hypothetical protein [Hyphomonas sp.]